MFQDALLQVDTDHAYTAVAVSENSIDLGDVTPKRVIGAGEEVGFGINIDVAADSTTVKFEIIQTTSAALDAGIIVLAEQTRLAADCPAGALIFMALPPQMPDRGRAALPRSAHHAGRRQRHRDLLGGARPALDVQREADPLRGRGDHQLTLVGRVAGLSPGEDLWQGSSPGSFRGVVRW